MDQNIMLVGTGLFLLLGLGIIGYSVYVHLHGMPVSQEQWRKDLIRWRVLGPNTLPQTLEDVKRCRDYLLSMGILASGICLVLAMIGWAMALLATGTSAADSPNQNNGAFFLASALLSVGIGLGSGAVFAAWRLRNAAKRGVTYADLRQRRLSDYRSNAFRWLVVAMIAWTFGVLWFFAPHGGSMLQIDLVYTIVSVPNTLWGLSIVPGVMVVVFVLVEMLLFRLVSFSRLLVTSDPTVSQHADDMLRANVIGSVQYCELVALGQLAALPYYMLSHLPYQGFLTISLFMPAGMQLLGLGIILGRGRLGGKLSGWPWQLGQIKQPEVEE